MKTGKAFKSDFGDEENTLRRQFRLQAILIPRAIAGLGKAIYHRLPAKFSTILAD